MFAYTRTCKGEALLTVCNFEAEEVPFEIPEEFKGAVQLISNYGDYAAGMLRPYEAFVLWRENA